MKRILSLFLVLVTLCNMLPASAFASRDTGLEGKKISILGDSISTYAGVSDNASVNATLDGGSIYYTPGRLGVYQSDTWWQQAIDRLGLQLTVNNAWSGSCILNTRSGTVGAYLDRCVQLHNAAGEEPDIIAVYLGTNDFCNYKSSLGTADAIDYDRLITKNNGTYSYAVPTTAAAAYAIMLHKAMVRYPNAEIYCFTLLPQQNLSTANQALMEQFNESIQAIAEHFGAYTVDLYNDSGIRGDKNFQFYVADNSLHPGPAGMDAITGCFTSALLKNSRYVSENVYDISYDLTDVIVDQGTAYAVLESRPFACSFTIPAGTELDVTVTMGGKDITDSCYASGTITIEKVTGDIQITALSVPVVEDPENFRWETKDDALVSITSDGNTENPLTMTHGTIKNGTFSKTRFTMQQRIHLLHDRPWRIEWKSSGTWTDTTDGALLFSEAASSATADACYFYRRHNNDFFAFGTYTGGQYHNYGVTFAGTGIDTTAEHVFCLENRITGSDSNMVYLLVDGVEVGPLNHHYIGGTDKKETVDWISGKDFSFSYMGTSPHTIGGCNLKYVQVWEEYHTHTYQSVITPPTGTEKGYTTYTCSACGDSFRTPWLDETTYEGKTIACVGDSITAAHGVAKDETDYVKLLADQLGMDYIRLGVSGTTLCTDGSRTCNISQLTADRLNGADVVTIAMGINDFVNAGAGYYELGDIHSTDTSTVYGAMRMWCEQIAELRKNDSLRDTQFYFVTPVICSWNNSVTTARDWDQAKTNIHGYTLRDMCNAIIEVAALYDVATIDLNLLSGMYYVDAEDNNVAVFGGDGVHPAAKGHEMMADALAKALLQHDLRDDHTHTFGSWITTTWPSCFAGIQQRVCSVCSATEQRTLESNNTHRYHTVVTAPTFTQQGYTTYTCSVCGESYVSDYTDPIQPHSYRWEMQNNAMVSVTTSGNTANALTLNSGSVTDGTLTSVRYSLQNQVQLYHHLPWVIEWRSTGNWSGMLLASSAQSASNSLTYLFRDSSSRMFAFGEYTGSWNNYGMILDCDLTVSHVFRLENRIAADGSNTVFLLVDGQEIGAMHQHYISGKDQNKTVNWANGKDITFANIGTTSHPVSGMRLEYLQIWENPHAHTYTSTVTAPTCTDRGFTTYTCACGDSYVDDYVDAVGHSYQNITCSVCGESFAEKSVSILSHSASTYAGVSNNQTFNSTIGKNDVYYTEGKHDVYRNDTWWQQAIDALGMKLLVNNSWSGSCVFQPRKGEASIGYGDRAVNLHNDHTGEDPDIIWVYLGCNDFAYYKDTFGNAEDVDYAALIQHNGNETFSYTEPKTTCEAYAIMLHKVQHRYPDAQIYCMTSTARRETDYTGDSYPDAGQPTQYSAQLQKVAAHFGFPVIDLEKAIPKDVAVFDQYMGDKRAHPNALGMDQITNEVLSVMLGKDTEICHVTSDDDTVAEQAVLLGGSYCADVTLQEGYSIVVTMDGKNITDKAYSNGKISIAEVTGDIVITSTIQRNPLNFRWEVQNDALVSIGETENALSMLAGTISNGVLNNTRYQMATPVVLKHDLPWQVEWQFTGNWRGCVFASSPMQNTNGMTYLSRTVGGQLSFGTWTGKQYDNYGVDLSYLDAQVHTYRLENRIAADDSNMVWVYVDGKEIGPMNHYYIGSKDQGTVSDWISGKDFVFSYIGMDGHALRDGQLHYLKVQEGAHSHSYTPTVTPPTCTEQGFTTYTCACGDSYVDNYETAGHTYENGFCSRCQSPADPYLQQLPEAFAGCSNLYELLTPAKGYYTATKYDTSNGNVLSVVIPVEPGDRIAASSFGSKAQNMGSVNGIRVTYLLDGTIVESLSADSVYTTYTRDGYLTVPEGVNMVSVPWWNSSNSNWLTLAQASKHYATHSPKAAPAQAPTCTEKGYTAGEICTFCGISLGAREEIPATGHTYAENTCTVCGAVNLLAFLEGKYVSILGDSISTFNGYSNDATVNSTIGGNGHRYDAGTADTKPGSYCLLESVDHTWWMHFANRSGMQLLVNNSWAGSQVFGGQTSDGRLIPAAYLDRCVNLHDNTLENNPGKAPIHPDVIFVYLGINDYNFNRSKVGSGAVDYAMLVNSDGSYATPTTFGEAYGILLHKMQKAYPNAQIFAMTLLPENLYSVDMTAWSQHNAYIRAAAEYYDVPLVDLAENCAITWENYSSYMMDKIHPTTAGMELISDCIEAELLAYYKENPPHIHTYENGFCTSCGSEEPIAAKPMSMEYDDHLDMSGKTVEIISAGTPTSYQVGYGVAENTVPDAAVVTMQGNTLVATGIGTAMVKIDGETYEIRVTAAPISLLLLIGQSNMQGIDGNASESIVCPTGQVYATYADRYKKTVEDVTKFAPSALTGEYSTWNVAGDRACLENYPVNMLTDAGNGREGMDSGIAYEWVKQTGEKVWTVNVGYGGSSITQWQKGGIHYQDCLELFAACQETLRKEIAAGHFTLSHMAYFWCQGCADENQTASWYADQFLKMHETLKKDMAFNENVTFEFAGIVPIRSGHDWVASYRAGVYKDSTTVPYYQSFKDLQFNGPRVAQYWMGNNPELKDIWNVCTIQEGWATLPDGSDGVSDYFRSAYTDGVVDYTTQIKQSAAWYRPTTPAAVHDNIHYNQIGYNELGRESARNALIMLGELAAPDVTPTVRFLTWDGFTPAEHITASTTGASGTLVVPMVYPTWKSKAVTYTVTDGLRYEYYDLLADSVRSEGSLTASLASASVTVAPRELTAFRWALQDSGLVSVTDNGFSENNLSKMAGSVTNQVFTDVRYQSSNPVQLLHTEQWCVEVAIENWTATAGTMVLSTAQTATKGAPYFYFRPSDFFIGIGCYNGSTYDNYGISLKQHGIACSQGSHTYRFVNRILDDGSNMVYLIVDGEEIGALTDHYVNSTLTDRDNNWLSGKDFAMSYFGTTTAPIRNCTVHYIAVTEAKYDPQLHLHNWSDWETVTAAGPEGPGEEKRSCPDCGEEQTREVNGVWQTHDLSAHLVALPDVFCSGTNLWTALPHDPMYYHSGEKWAVHESGTIHSVTIAVNGGDQIFATSFGKYGDNGNTIGTGNGIRVTFFGADGVLKTMEPQKTYEESAANGGYIAAPEGTVAVNIPMYGNHDTHELYILNRDHTYENGTCTGCGIAEPPTNGAAVVTGSGDTTEYATFAEAMQAASSGDTVVLLKDAQTYLLTIPANIALDLNGYGLSANYVACFGHITDNSPDNTGLLKVAKTNFLIQKSNRQMPIRDQGGYRFVEISQVKQRLYPESSKLAFQPLFEEAAHAPLLLGSAQSGITVTVKVTWQHAQGPRSQDFVYTDSLVNQFIRSYISPDRYNTVLTLTLSGAEKLKNVTCQVIVKSDCGPEFASELIPYPGT